MSQLSEQLRNAGIRPGAVVLVHSSLSAISGTAGPLPGGADAVIDSLLEAIGPAGTLCMPCLSYLHTTETHPVFSVRDTPSHVGLIPETFRQRPGVIRSEHPTHSVCAVGPKAAEVCGDHWRDTTPVGPHSPFRKVCDLGGQVVFLGCGARCNTSMHGVEELYGEPPFLFLQNPIVYTVIDADGNTKSVVHRRHNFEGTGQRYERLLEVIPLGPSLRSIGTVGTSAVTHVFEAAAMWGRALETMQQRGPLFFVDRIPPGAESHVFGSGGRTYKYVVV